MTASVIKPPVGGERRTLLAIEAVSGITPSGATWYDMPNNGGSGVTQENDTTESEELTPTLGTTDIVVVQRNGTFSYDFEMFRDDIAGSHTYLFESLLANKFVANELVNGVADNQSLVIEDGIESTKTYIHVNNAYATAFNLTIANGEIASGSWEGQGTPQLNEAESVVGVANIDFLAGTNQIATGSGDLPLTVVAGDYVLVSNANTPANNGYYPVISVDGADLITVDGLLTADTSDSATLRYSPHTIVDGTIVPNQKYPKMKAGDFIEVEVDGSDTLDYGLRFTSATIAIARTREDLFEITLDKSFTSAGTALTVTVEFEWHQINDDLLRRLDAETEHAIVISANSIDGRKITFEFPRGKFSAGAFGSASKSATLAGTSTYTALLDPNNELVRILYS